MIEKSQYFVTQKNNKPIKEMFVMLRAKVMRGYLKSCQKNAGYMNWTSGIILLTRKWSMNHPFTLIGHLVASLVLALLISVEGSVRRTFGIMQFTITSAQMDTHQSAVVSAGTTDTERLEEHDLLVGKEFREF